MDGYCVSCCNMIIETTGFGKKQNKLIHEAVAFFVEKLIHPRTRDVLELSFVREDIEEDGLCEYEYDNITPRCFSIEISKKLKGDEFIKTIAHELVHVKQYVTGQLKERYKPSSHLLWRNEIVEPTEKNYFDAPWEVEAREMEEKLFDLFENRNNKK